ncbi:MAG TPA: 4Fe-4S binding protein [Candidatus Hydrogenedentes bacterium]|nr:4Fe-4S binding protein [Candidatus Hydrogenedentota bacterium]
MAAIVDADKCGGCKSCVEVCPTESITINEDGKAVVDPDSCGECGACVDECPNEAINLPD